MIKISKKETLLFFLLPLLVIKISNANNFREIKWSSSLSLKVSEKETVKYMSFEGAIYDFEKSFLPLFFEKIKLSENIKDVNITLENTLFEVIPDSDVELIRNSSSVSNELVIDSRIGYERNESYALMSFVPIRKNKLTGKYERLISFNFVLNKVSSITKHASPVNQKTSAVNSVLATGNWYKVGVVANGIYQLSYTYLKNLGLNVLSLDPRNLRIYGNGGGMLPYANDMPHYDDLVENAIEVKGENDGVFNEDDYILFYGESQNTWSYSDVDKRFLHLINRYSDTTYYFITVDLGRGKRISKQLSSSLSFTNTVSSFDDYAFHESDAVNLIKSGREWYGESFDLVSSYDFPFNFPNIDVKTPVYVKADIAARNNFQSTFTINSQSSSVSLYPPATDVNCYYCDYAMPASGSFTFVPTTPNIIVNVSKITSSAIGWLNYIELNARRQLIMNGNQLLFRDVNSVGKGNVSEFKLSSSLSIKIWEVTDPTNVKDQSVLVSGNSYQYVLPTDSLREFIAYTGDSYYTPIASGFVPNQNIHAFGQTDLIIVSHPDFINQANILADLHRNNDGLSSVVVTPQQIYNEFSSGSQDISAIRNFVKMFFDRAMSAGEGFPRYLLLFGDGSYDNKRFSSSNTNFIPTYQSENSTSYTASYVSDDFYGLLNDNEGEWNSNDLVDIGIGRLPVRSVAEAQAVVNKIIKYTSKSNIPASKGVSCESQSSSSVLGDWRNMLCFIGDDEDGGLHENQANQLATFVDTTYGNYNIDKIYLDAYLQQATPGGQRYPDVVEAINKRVAKGALVINYTGHGGEVGLAHERIVEVSQINQWKNINNLPLFFTATCEFSRFDDPGRTSAGEYVLLNPNGGGIALLTTVRLVYATPNFYLNKNFYNYAFSNLKNEEMPRLGDLYRLTKVASGSSVNNRNFTLLGDPALCLAYPEKNVYTTTINENPVNMTSPDTVKALSAIAVSGYVGSKNGSKMDSYNGTLYVTVFDKAQNITTLSNDGIENTPPMTFSLQKNVLYKGKVDITNGNFSFSFVVPKDIAYHYGMGRISYYAENGMEDASGYYENIVIGGAEDSVVNDIIGPEVKLYMNDNKFITGGVTNEHPDLYAIVSDFSGINTVGNGIGHDITAVLDDNTGRAIMLNDYYQADLNSYKSGTVRYPLSELSEGKHTLKFKIWDVYNNSSQDYTEFVVAKSAQIALTHVLNYPNPFTSKTKFFFEHNQACDELNVQIQIFTISGKLIKTINTYAHTEGFRSEAIEWDGRDDYGDQIGKGVYMYRLKVRSVNGSMATKIEKLVVLN